jgi:microcystin-dependent protein
MADAFIGEIRILPYTFTPAGWLPCNGSLQSMAQYQALYTLLGTRFGGDGKSTFGLPNLQGVIVVNAGQGPGLSNYIFAQGVGTQTVALTSSSQMPAHGHVMNGRNSSAGVTGMTSSPNTNTPLSMLSRALVPSTPNPKIEQAYAQPGPSTTIGMPVSVVGTGAAHANMMPYLAMRYCICWEGIYPVKPN